MLTMSSFFINKDLLFLLTKTPSSKE